MDNTLGERLNNLRIDNRWTQKAVADRLGITSSTLSQYEKNKRIPKKDVLLQLADLYNVSTDYLLGHSNNPELEYNFEPQGHTQLSSSTESTYDLTTSDSDLNDAKTRFLAAINKLPQNKQMQILTICELFIGVVSRD